MRDPSFLSTSTAYGTLEDYLEDRAIPVRALPYGLSEAGILELWLATPPGASDRIPRVPRHVG